MSELKITTERVQEAAKRCPDAARVLKTLFPEAFKPEPYSTSGLAGKIDLSPMLGYTIGSHVIENRTGGNYIDRGFYLPTNRCGGNAPKRWTVEVDDVNIHVLVPHRE